MREIVNEILSGENLRANLSTLRAHLKSKEVTDHHEWIDMLHQWGAEENDLIDAIMKSLENADPKTRKNAALLLGDYNELFGAGDDAPGKIWDTYKADDTRFVKASYIKALSHFDCSAYIDELKDELNKLHSTEMEVEEVKHVRELRAEISKLLENCQAPRKAKPIHPIKKKHVIVVEAEEYINKNIAKFIAESLGEKTTLLSRGVKASTDRIMTIARLPYYREIWFLIRFKTGKSNQLDKLAESLCDSELLPLLHEAYGKADEYTFKIENTDDLLSKNAKMIGMAIEEESGYKLKNVITNPDIYIKMYKKKDGGYAVYGRLPGLGADRFDYMHENLPTSMSPVVAAQMAELIMPYTSEGTQIIDPFCGTAALLLARTMGKKPKYVYGIDKYGQAIDIARQNAAAVGADIYFINRDFFDFTSDYMMDEIITEFPRMENLDRNEVEEFYRNFFQKAIELTDAGAMLFLLTQEENLIKKQVRLNAGLELVRQIPMRGHDQIYILKRRG